MQQSDTKVNSLSQLEIFVLPSAAYTAFSGKFNLADIHDYGKLRNVLSVKDIAEAIIVNQDLVQKSSFWNKGNSIEGYSGTSSLLEHNKLTGDQRLEVDSTLYHYVYDKKFVEETLNSYVVEKDGGGVGLVEGADFSGDKKSTQVPYKVSIVGSSLYIIVEEGFLSFFTEKVLWLDFLRRVLKAACAVADINKVNGTEFYAQYVAALVAKQ